MKCPLDPRLHLDVEESQQGLEVYRWIIDLTMLVFKPSVQVQTIKVQKYFFPMGTNFVSLLANLFLSSFEADFLPKLSQKKKRFHKPLIDDVLSLNNSVHDSVIIASSQRSLKLVVGSVLSIVLFLVLYIC